MKRVLRWGLLLVALLSSAGVFAKEKGGMQLLFVIEANHASLKYLGDKTYQLAIKRADVVDSVLAFSDRPYRKAYRLKLADYQQMVEAGNNAFLRMHPNVVLSWGDRKEPAEAYTIKAHKLTPSLVTFTLLRISDQPRMQKNALVHQGHVSLFIDNYSFDPKKCYSEPDYRGVHTFACGLCCYSSG